MFCKALKIPKTSLNLIVLGLSDNPDILADFPYEEHTFSEYRDGLLFISGVCTLLKILDEELELSVIWGNTINMLSLKNLKLRELNSNKYLRWNEDSKFLASSSTDQTGFVVVDFGRGTSNFNYIHPSITIQGILDLIEESTSVHFDYPDRFNDTFTKKWIPLLEKNANDLTWLDYTATCGSYGFFNSNGDFMGKTFIDLKPISNPHDIVKGNYYEGADRTYFNQVKREGKTTIKIQMNIELTTGEINSQKHTQAGIYIQKYGENGYGEWYKFDVDRYDTPLTGNTEIIFSRDVEVPDGSVVISPMLYMEDEQQNKSYFTDLNIIKFSFSATAQDPEVKFGDRFPIVPNLPDISVVEFLKTIMQMYGLYTYYDYKLDKDAIQFISIDDIYTYKHKETNEKGVEAYDWTNKLVTTNRGKSNLTFVYGDYAQKNNFKYTQDSGVAMQADGALLIYNKTISEEKDLVDIPFAPSDNIGRDREGENIIAQIKLYDGDGKIQSLKSRILTQRIYDPKENPSIAVEYISAYFDDTLKFSGEEGLLAKYYTAFQHILKRPIVMECYVYLSDYELHNYREVRPVFIDGTYYMPIEVTVQTDSLAVCKLIKMPYLEAKEEE